MSSEEERRDMNESERKRDAIMGEVHSDIKYLVKTMDAHVVLDDKRFDEVKGKLEFHQKIVYGCIGVFSAVEILFKFFK